MNPTLINLAQEANDMPPDAPPKAWQDLVRRFAQVVRANVWFGPSPEAVMQTAAILMAGDAESAYRENQACDPVVYVRRAYQLAQAIEQLIENPSPDTPYLKVLEAALKPFAEVGANLDWAMPDNAQPISEPRLTVKDFRKARDALRSMKRLM